MDRYKIYGIMIDLTLLRKRNAVHLISYSLLIYNNIKGS